MKKLTTRIGCLAAAFVLVSVGASCVGARRLHQPSATYWNGNQFAPNYYNENRNRGYHVGPPRAHSKKSLKVPRGQWNQRGVDRRPGEYEKRDQMGNHKDRHPVGASFRGQHDDRGGRGHVSNRHAGRDDDTAHASDDAHTHRGNRDGWGWQRQR